MRHPSEPVMQESPVRLDLLFAATVIVGYLPALFFTPLAFLEPRGLIALGLGGVYIYLGLGSIPPRSPRLPGWLSQLTPYFSIQLLLVAGIFAALADTAAAFWLIPLPLVAESVERLRQRRWLWVAGAAELLFVVVSYFQGGWIDAALSGLIYLSAVGFVVGFTLVAVREAQARHEVERLAAELEEANARLRAYSAQVEEMATVQERNRLAREIHDNLGHYLTVVNVQLEAARTVLESSPAQALEAMNKAQSLAQEGLREVRNSVAALRAPPLEEKPLPQALEELAEDARTQGLMVQLDVSGEPRPLQAQTAVALYRTAQEGLTNVRRHARASNVRILLAFENGQSVRLTIEDNGVGDQGSSEGFGLLGIRERVQLLGGWMKTHSASGQGFQLTVEVPT